MSGTKVKAMTMKTLLKIIEALVSLLCGMAPYIDLGDDDEE